MKKIALLFPGQGAQYVGMGSDLYESSPAAKEVFDSAAALMGGDFLKTLFEGPEEALKRTDVTQVAVYTVSLAALAALREKKPELSVVAAGGLSLGEYAALTAAGVLSFAEGLKLVRSRSLFMQEAAEKEPGAMAAVLQLDGAVVKEICAKYEKVYVANFNCPGQIVISGSPAGVEEASKALLEAGARRVLPLAVGGAFHSPFMEPAREKLLPLLIETKWGAMNFPVVSNVLGAVYPEDASLPEMLGRQIVESVLWEEDFKAILNFAPDLCLELGPGNVLCGLAKKISREALCKTAGKFEEITSILENDLV